MKSIKRIQMDHRLWQTRNFGPVNPVHSIFGVMEELGELSHSHLKNEQNIRTNENHIDNARDAVGDIFIYLMSYCTSQGWDIKDIIEETWNEVEKRDWLAYPETGRPPNEIDNNST